MKLKLKRSVPILFLLYSSYYFLEPFLSGWFEIVDPSIARMVFLPLRWMSFVLVTLPIAMVFGDVAFYTPDILFATVLALYLVYYLRVGRYEINEKHKKLAYLPLIALSFVFIVMIPLGFTSRDRHVNSFPVGGWSRLMMAGGPSRVREEALQLLNSTKEERPDWSEIPPTLKRLGGWVGVEHENRLVIVGLGRMFNMADEFGFVFQEEDSGEPNPAYLERFDFQRFWKLAEGVYFYEVP